MVKSNFSRALCIVLGATLLLCATTLHADVVTGYTLSATAGTSENTFDFHNSSGPYGRGTVQESAMYDSSKEVVDFSIVARSDVSLHPILVGVGLNTFHMMAFHVMAQAAYDGPSPSLISAHATADISFTDTLTILYDTTDPISVNDIRLAMQVRVSGQLQGDANATLGTSGSLADQTIELESGSNTIALPIALTGNSLFIQSDPFTLSVSAIANGTSDDPLSIANLADTVTVLGFTATDTSGRPLDLEILSGAGFKYLNLSAVPEPSSAVILGLGSIATSYFFRRRHRSNRINLC